MSRYYDLTSNAVLFDELMLPMEAFLTTGDTEEMALVTKIFEFAKEIAQLKLSEVTLSLYSAFILLQDGEWSVVVFPSDRLSLSRPERTEESRGDQEAKGSGVGVATEGNAPEPSTDPDQGRRLHSQHSCEQADGSKVHCTLPTTSKLTPTLQTTEHDAPRGAGQIPT